MKSDITPTKLQADYYSFKQWNGSKRRGLASLKNKKK
jgi:hypothetical protein